MIKTLKLEGLDCANCLSKMERKISKLKGVINVSSNFFTEKLTIEAEDETINDIEKEAFKIIKKLEPQIVIKNA